MESSKLMKVLSWASKGAMILGAVASLVGSIVDDKKHSLEMKAAVKEEVAKIAKEVKSGS